MQSVGHRLLSSDNRRRNCQRRDGFQVRIVDRCHATNSMTTANFEAAHTSIAWRHSRTRRSYVKKYTRRFDIRLFKLFILYFMWWRLFVTVQIRQLNGLRNASLTMLILDQGQGSRRLWHRISKTATEIVLNRVSDMRLFSIYSFEDDVVDARSFFFI